MFAGVIFDLDGTLIDSALDVAAAVNRALAERRRRAVSLEEVRGMVGYGVGPLLRSALEATGMTPSDQDVASAIKSYLGYYRQDPAGQTIVFPGVRDALQQLSAAGVRLGICTNKPHELTGLVLEALDLAPLFGAVAGGDFLPYRKPDRRHLDHVRLQLGCDRKPTAFVGDSETDVAAARAAEIPVVAVTFGYAHGSACELDADRTIGSFSELPDMLVALSSSKEARQG